MSVTNHLPNHRRYLRGISVALAAAVVLGGAGGCYERVVGVKGPGADAYDVYSPNLKTKNEAIKQKTHSAPNKTVPSKVADE